MRRLWLDYQQPPPGYLWPGLLLLVIAFILTGTLIAYESSLSEALDRQDQQVQKLRRQVARQQSATAALNASPSLGETLSKQMAAGAGDRWEAFFTTLESAADESVTLVNVSPDQDEITLNGEAKNLAVTTDYAKRLQAAPLFSGVHITEYDIAKDRPQHPVRFTLVAHWREVP